MWSRSGSLACERDSHCGRVQLLDCTLSLVLHGFGRCFCPPCYLKRVLSLCRRHFVCLCTVVHACALLCTYYTLLHAFSMSRSKFESDFGPGVEVQVFRTRVLSRRLSPEFTIVQSLRRSRNPCKNKDSAPMFLYTNSKMSLLSFKYSPNVLKMQNIKTLGTWRDLNGSPGIQSRPNDLLRYSTGSDS